MSIDHMISIAIAPVGALLSGPLALFIGIRSLFLIAAILGIIHPFLIWYFTKIRRLEVIEREIVEKAKKDVKVEDKAEKTAEVEEIVESAEVIQVIEPVE